MKPIFAVFGLAALGAAGCVPPAVAEEVPEEPEAPRIDGLRAFARLYGVLRYFHPSDEAADLDWDRFAALGVQRTRDFWDRDALATTLDQLVRPIAPTVRIRIRDVPPSEVPELAEPAEGGELVAWQHLGAGLGLASDGTYGSVRTHRPTHSWVDSTGWTAMGQAVDAVPLRGKPFRLEARVHAGSRSRVGAWARVDRVGGAMGFFDNMMDRSVARATWTEVAVEGRVDDDAERIVVGGLVEGHGPGAFDTFRLTVDGAPIALADPDFERQGKGWSAGVAGVGKLAARGWSFEAVGAAGDRSLEIRPTTLESTGTLFEGHAEAGEVAHVDLGDWLVADVPIALWSTPGPGGHTLPVGDPAALTAALGELDTSLSDPDARMADLVVAWSALEQFYPYFSDVKVDFDQVLDDVLDDALDDADPADHRRTLQRLVASVQDGHGAVFVPDGRRDALPVAMDAIEGQVVVVGSSVPEVRIGDVITAIDEVPARRMLDEEMQRWSGSPQWRRVRATWELGSGPPGSTATLALDRAGEALTVQVPRGQGGSRSYAHPPIDELEGGVWYVDLGRADVRDLERRANVLARAPGVVLDMRGYPNDTHDVLRHLLDAPEHDRWMHVAELVRPALPGEARPEHGWEDLGWDLRPARPRFTGKVVFLAGGGSISYAESVMGYPEALGLDVVGGPTAGANGNIRFVELPTGSQIVFTGMRVTRHDGTPSHTQGIRPTIPVEPTLDGVRAGRDEVLERALELIRGAG